MSLNLTPFLKENQPTSHVKIGAKKLDSSTDIVRLRHKNRETYFYVKAVDDRLIDEIENGIRMHKNVEKLFGGIQRSANFYVNTDVSIHEIEFCKSAKVYVGGADEGTVQNFLVENEYLLHPIEERVSAGDSMISIDVLEMEPQDYNTLRVTSDTNLEFLDAGEYREYQSKARETDTSSGRSESPTEGDESVTVNIDPKKPTKSFEEDVAGLEEVKETARMLLSLFDPDTRNEVRSRYGEQFASRGGSMLLYGPPGCGKTLVAEAIANEAKYNTNIEEVHNEVKYLEIKGSDILSKYSGESEKRVESVFERAHGIAQDGFCVLFFDEIETLIPDRSDDNLQRHERSLTNAFLQEMNEVEDNLLVIGATNMPFNIDAAAARRFPIQQFIPEPDEEVMAKVWKKNLTNVPNIENIDFEKLAAESTNYTPAEVADRVLGNDLKRELIQSVTEPNKEPIELDTKFLIERLKTTDPKTIRQYLTSVRQQMESLEGYPELRKYVERESENRGFSSNEGLANILEAINDSEQVN